MVALSSGEEWANIIKPILSLSYDSFDKHHIDDLVFSILGSVQELYNPDPAHEAFYSTFCALSADCISSVINTVLAPQMDSYCEACRALLSYLMRQLQTQTAPDATPGTLSVRQLLSPIRALCTGSGQLSRSEQYALAALMKNAQPAMQARSSTPATDLSGGAKDGIAVKTELKAGRSGVAQTIVEQLTKPQSGVLIERRSVADVITAKQSTDAQLCADYSRMIELESYFTRRNIDYLRSLEAGDVLVDICMNLPFIGRYIGEWNEFARTNVVTMPVTVNEASLIRQSLPSLLNDISIIANTLHLPILEPLTVEKSHKLNTLALASLYAALSASMAMNLLSCQNLVSPKTSTATVSDVTAPKTEDDNSEMYAGNVMERAIEVYKLVDKFFQTSTRAGGHVSQNFVLMSAWLLVSGLYAQITYLKEDKGKSPVKHKEKEKDKEKENVKEFGNSRYGFSFLKVQYSYSVYSLVLTSHALSLISELMEDADLELSKETDVQPAPLDLTAVGITGLQRVAKIFQVADGLLRFLFYLSPILYRKGQSLKRNHRFGSSGDTYSASGGSTTYYDDDIITVSDESTAADEEDSEPILGHWIGETLLSENDVDSSPESRDNSCSVGLPKDTDKENANADNSNSLIPEKGDPHAYFQVVNEIFNFLNEYLVSTDWPFIHEKLKTDIRELDIFVLASMINDLDHETGFILSNFGPSGNMIYKDLSESLMIFVHNLLTKNVLSDVLLDRLLDGMGVNPYISEERSNWPLLIYPRVLSVLTQVVLIKSNKEVACASIWAHVINSLTAYAITIHNEDVRNDLNIEHAQLLMFLFNFLTFMQKKSTLLRLARSLVLVSRTDTGLEENPVRTLAVGRMLMLFEHIMKYLYDPPSVILEQVQYNIVGPGLHGAEVFQLSPYVREEMKCPWRVLEQCYRKYTPNEGYLKPLFYSLSQTNFDPNEIPKLDGLALNFLLGNFENLKYCDLIQALFTVANFVNLTWKNEREVIDVPYNTLCSVQYSATLAWRMLLQLPPCAPHLEKMLMLQNDTFEPSLFTIYASFWGPRCNTFMSWLKECLGKQSSTQPRDITALQSVAEAASGMKYDFTLLKAVINNIVVKTELSEILESPVLPKFTHIMICDTLIWKMMCSLDDVSQKATENESNKARDAAEGDAETVQTSGTGKSQQTQLIKEMLALVLDLAEQVSVFIRYNILRQIQGESLTTAGATYTLHDLRTIAHMAAVSPFGPDMTRDVNCSLAMSLPLAAHKVSDRWNDVQTPFDDLTAVRSEKSVKDSMNMELTSKIKSVYAWETRTYTPNYNHALTVMNFHLHSLSSQSTFTVNPSLKHLLLTALKFIKDHLSIVLEDEALRDRTEEVVLPISLDFFLTYTNDSTWRILLEVVGPHQSDQTKIKCAMIKFQHMHSLLMDFASDDKTEYNLESVESVAEECSQVLVNMMADVNSRIALLQLSKLQPTFGLHAFFMTIMSDRSGQVDGYISNILKALNKVFDIAENNPNDVVSCSLLSTLMSVFLLPEPSIERLVNRAVVGAYAVAFEQKRRQASDRMAAAAAEVESGTSGSMMRVMSAFVGMCQDIAVHTVHQGVPLQPDNYMFVKCFVEYLVNTCGNPKKEELAYILLLQLIQVLEYLLKEVHGNGFVDLLNVTMILADFIGAEGHVQLFRSFVVWLYYIKGTLGRDDTLQKVRDNNVSRLNEVKPLLETATAMCNYVSDVLEIVQSSVSHGTPSPQWDTDATPAIVDLVALREQLRRRYGRPEETNENGGDDSDEENLSNKLCTFTVSQKEFMNQHWYHCHTCKMVDKVGVCSICARVCHKGHDVTYSKYGNFFCDCGARVNSNCQALTKRSSSSRTRSSSGADKAGSSTSSRRKSSGSSSMITVDFLLSQSQVRMYPSDPRRFANLRKQIESVQQELLRILWIDASFMTTLMDIVQLMVPLVEDLGVRISPIGCYDRARKALVSLHTDRKKIVLSDKLVVPTPNAPEGNLESVRMNFTGDQGQAIRQLLSAHLVKRTAVCCISPPPGKRYFFVSSHEKGKISLLPMGQLLRNDECKKEKVDLSRVASAPIPFSVLSLTPNPANEEFVAVCGLKECHVLTFTIMGKLTDHLILHPQLETGNFIIKAVWLPGSQTRLAIVTADFVKVYDLSKDVLSPQFFFLLPTGKIRDVTFSCHEDYYPMIIIMSSVGYIYMQEMNEESAASHGPFYVTSTYRMEHSEIVDVNGQICAGGISVYYSHALRALCMSFATGRSFIVFLPDILQVTDQVYEVTPASVGVAGSVSTPASKTDAASTESEAMPDIVTSSTSTSSSTKNGTSSGAQPLWNWSEIPSHPGLIFCFSQGHNTPVVLMVQPDSILVQEFKPSNVKSKVMDLMAVQYPVSATESHTSIVLLYDDGTLRVYHANDELTGFWISPIIRPASPEQVVKTDATKKKKTKKDIKSTEGSTFPVDFFEHNTLLSDIEFGGNDLLQIYNTVQVKHRLNTPGMNVVSTKPTGFQITIENKDTSHVLTGIRVLLGCGEANRVPCFIEVCGRMVPTAKSRERWFDIPLTREEALRADNKLTVKFGPSSDQESINVVDSIKVYGKTKIQFQWPDDVEDLGAAGIGAGNISSSNQSTPLEERTLCTSFTTSYNDSVFMSKALASYVEKFTCSLLETLKSSYVLMNYSDYKDPETELNMRGVQLATNLLLLPSPVNLILHTKAFLSTMFSTALMYHSYKDTAILLDMIRSLRAMAKEESGHLIDPEAYYHAVTVARNIATMRPGCLGRLTQDATMALTNARPGNPERTPITELARDWVTLLVDVFWLLFDARPANPLLPCVMRTGLSHLEVITFSLVEILNAILTYDQSDATFDMIVQFYLRLLLCDSTVVSFTVRTAIVSCLKPKKKHKSSGRTPKTARPVTPLVEESSHSSRTQEHSEIEFNVDPIGDGADLLNQVLMDADGAFQLDMLPQDADDETMVELAIALSLQEQDDEPELEAMDDEIQDVDDDDDAMNALHEEMESSVASGLQVHEVNEDAVERADLDHESDGSVSAAASDDEGSMAAIDGSTLRTSPADQSLSQDAETEPDDIEDSSSLPNLRLILLEKFIAFIPEFHGDGGIRFIPFMQVLFALTEDLNCEKQRDRAVFDALLEKILAQLKLNETNPEKPEKYEMVKPMLQGEYSPRQKYLMILLRFLSVLMSHVKSSSKSTNRLERIPILTANALLQAGINEWCLRLHQQMISYWKNKDEETPNTVVGALLKPRPEEPIPDAAPFFLRQYMKGHCDDMFKLYPQLLTEIALRLPYQVQKHSTIHTPSAIDEEWSHTLCQYMMSQQTPFVRRQVRKLLLFKCGSKEKYRQTRDVHALETHMSFLCSIPLPSFSESSETGDGAERMPLTVSLAYDWSVKVVEHLRACAEVAVNRFHSWATFLLERDRYVVRLFALGMAMDEAIAQIVLQLLRYPICGVKAVERQNEGSSKPSSSLSTTPDEVVVSKPGQEEQLCAAFTKKVYELIPSNVLSRFIKAFLLETNSSNLRWQAHSLLVKMFGYGDSNQQQELLNIMWSMWYKLPSYGRRATQFLDLAGYFLVKCGGSSSIIKAVIPHTYLDDILKLMHSQNEILEQHPNASLYQQLSQYVELGDYYLESEPCLICNNPEVPFQNVKLSSIKADSKFTTSTQLVKLSSSYMISKICLRISDLKRTKMVRTINIYYNNRCVQSVVELKNKPALWFRAKKMVLTSGQTEAKVEFPLPIVACNLTITYSEFYENLQASTETLQCPRCSAAVPANPGVCSNCGENVFQCHKCRAINYDEKDPFLCHVCGYCKYAKFDYMLTAKPVFAIEAISTDAERKKVAANINQLLEKADRTYKTLVGVRPTLEVLLSKLNLNKQNLDSANIDDQGQTTVPPGCGAAQVNRLILALALKYTLDCKSTYEELSKTIQKIIVSRKELVKYDRKEYEQGGPSGAPSSSSDANTETLATDLVTLCKFGQVTREPVDQNSSRLRYRCYGCASAVIEHCLTILKALSMNPVARRYLCDSSVVDELVQKNLRRAASQNQSDVKQLICMLIKDNPKATEELCCLLMNRISIALRTDIANSDLIYTVHPDVNLLKTMLKKEDSCWEIKAKCVMKLFIIASKECKSPAIVEAIVFPCLNSIFQLIKPDGIDSKKIKGKAMENLATVELIEDITTNVYKWIDNDSQHSYQSWKRRMPSKYPKSKLNSKSIARKRYLREKYANRWKERAFHTPRTANSYLSHPEWLKAILFNSGSERVREQTCRLLLYVCTVSPVHHKKVLDVLTEFLPEVNGAGAMASEYLSLYRQLIVSPPWKQYLTMKGVLLYLADLFNQEIQNLYHLEQVTLSSDLAQGFVMKNLTEIIASFMEVSTIKQKYKGRLVGTILNSYLALRRLVIQRTRTIDETQEKLLELLEDMTTGTEAETREFMAICIETLEKCSPNDVRTPVFIFERLCSIIFPEENEVKEFFMCLEKDPQQEDFLQGRMVGNPYSSNEPGLGPLMRDVKNKICQDCELVALLEDDNGMELLVNNKIISLDLPVSTVYKKLWLAESNDSDPMRIVYRMRGLLGDATEEFIETLVAKKDQEVNNEQVYRMANVMAECGGLEIVLKRLGAIRDINRSQNLLQVMFKLLNLCLKVQRNQVEILRPELDAVSKLLSILEQCLDTENETVQNSLLDQVLEILEVILSKASRDYSNDFERYARICGVGVGEVDRLLRRASNVRAATLPHFTKVVAALTYGNQAKMEELVAYFESVFDLEKFDRTHTPEDEQKIELLCNITAAIEQNELGNSLKGHINTSGHVFRALYYITTHAPSTKSTFWRFDSDDWKEYISRPALKYVLRFLTGLVANHNESQTLFTQYRASNPIIIGLCVRSFSIISLLLHEHHSLYGVKYDDENKDINIKSIVIIPDNQMSVSQECIAIIHRLEQVASEERVGTLAENLLEALRTNEMVSSRIEVVREKTRAEKKRLAMKMREKQLGALGMRSNDKGQVTAQKSVLEQMEELAEETGLTCVICREGYKFQPTKVLGIYTYTKRCLFEEAEVKLRKTNGYSTVTHFNVVHIDCHMAAVRLARTRDEWESAALQNANTRCNGLLPLWGPQVPESAFASCLARHNTYLQESTSHRDIGYASTTHDLKLLLLRFAGGKSFHEDCGGGGPQSNMQLIPYLMHMALYVINTTRCVAREEQNLRAYLDAPREVWVTSAYELEGPFYWACFSLMLHSYTQWKRYRLTHLRRLVVTSVARQWPNFITGAEDLNTTDYNVHKTALVFFGLIDALYNNVFQLEVPSGDQYPAALADFIRHHDEFLLKKSEKMMSIYKDDLMACTSFEEFCDVTGLLSEIANPSTFITEILASLVPSSSAPPPTTSAS